jgi:hypothetical protein
MNNNNNNNNNNNTQSMLTLDNLYDLLGSYYFMDFFHMFIVAPINLIGIITNIACLLILSEKFYFQSTFYKYLCIVCLKSAIRNLFTVFLMFFLSRRYFAFASAYWASLVLGYLITPVLTTLFLFGSLVDIWITLEKLARFKRIYNKLLIFSPFKTSILLLLFSILINCPTYFKLASVEITVLDTYKNVTRAVYFVKFTSFSKSWLGKNLIIMIVVFKSIGVLFILVVLNSIMLNILRVYFKYRMTMVTRKDQNQRLQERDALLRQNANNDNSNRRSIANLDSFKIKRLTNTERKTLKIIIIFCSATILEHFFYILVSLCGAYFRGLLIQLITSLGILYCTFKNISHFFILNHYNVVFRRLVRFHLSKFSLNRKKATIKEN